MRIPDALPLSSLALCALLALGACGGIVAPDAPALLSTEDLAARSALAGADPLRGERVAGDLAARADRLQARAAQLRRASVPDTQQAELLRRAEALKDR